jgi:hypothetical protein
MDKPADPATPFGEVYQAFLGILWRKIPCVSRRHARAQAGWPASASDAFTIDRQRIDGTRRSA